MSDIFISALVVGVSKIEWENNPKMLSSVCLSVIQKWISSDFNCLDKEDISDEMRRDYGRIKQSYFGMINDIYNLSNNYHMLQYFLHNKEIEGGFKISYAQTITENYIFNLRCIYDFLSHFARIFMEPKNVKSYLNTKTYKSLNTFIGYCEKHQKVLPQEIINYYINLKHDLDVIKKIRDTIVHDGKEPFIDIIDNEFSFKVSASNLICNDIIDILSTGNNQFPLFKYLKTLTNTLFNSIEVLGNILGNESHKRNSKFVIERTAISGISIADFKLFLSQN
ncbi:MAG: hypothetical protein IMY72_00650 [Bacteroidetes bacterium]|nr:hypothetical protein [Bacteroidota bacterium]